jgi:monovalent cation:H+ antiporter-2, CPA2 family
MIVRYHAYCWPSSEQHLQVLFKLAATLAVAFALSKSIVPALVSQLRSSFSDELFQLAMIGYCLSCAWICNKLGLSHELGAFLAGVMISTFEHHTAVALSTEQV